MDPCGAVLQIHLLPSQTEYVALAQSGVQAEECHLLPNPGKRINQPLCILGSQPADALFRFLVQRQLGCLVYPLPFPFCFVKNGTDQGEIAVFGAVAAGQCFHCLHDETAIEAAQFPAAQGGKITQAGNVVSDTLFSSLFVYPLYGSFVPQAFGFDAKFLLLPQFVFQLLK